MRLATVGVLLAVLLLPPRLAAALTDKKTAQIELTTGGTVYGVGLGLMVAWHADLNARPAAWVTAALAGGMLYGTWKAAEWGKLSLDRARFIETATVWTTADTMLLNFAIDGIDDKKGVAWLGLGAFGLSAALAALVAPAVHASAGQLSLVSSGGIWAPVSGVLLGVTAHLGDGEPLPRDLLILNLVGLTTAGVLTKWYDPERKQVLYMDAGLLLGGLSGGLLGVILLPVSDNYEQISGLALVGMGVGAWIALRGTGLNKRGQAPAAPAAAETALMLPVWSTSW